MLTITRRRVALRSTLLLAALCGLLPASLRAQDRFHALPLYKEYQTRLSALRGSVTRGDLLVTWSADGKAFSYNRNGKVYRYDIAARKALPTDKPETGGETRNGRFRRIRSGGGPARGRQFSEQVSPDGKTKAFYRDRNLWLSDASGANEIPITINGDVKTRIKYGTASWVYGEELDQVTAMWWSPDSKKIAFYRFDESKVKDYYLAMNAVDTQDTLDAEPYPKSGANNPIADIILYDLTTKKMTPVDVRDGKAFSDDVVGHYVYAVRWSPDGRELLFNRTNRRQNILEFVAANPESGKCRVILREAWPASWTENRPPVQFLKDGKRFLLLSERTGFRNLTLYDLSGKLLATLTNHPFDVEAIERVDEAAGVVFYRARSGDNPYKMQLHRVRLDGSEEKRLTDPALNHEISLAPDGKHFVDTAETHDTPPVSRLCDDEGNVLSELSQSDTSKFDALGGQKPELFTFKAADGKTDLYGMLYKPTHFDPSRKYPLLVSVYGGPESGMVSERFGSAFTDRLTELGFLVAMFDGRGTSGRGKRFKDEMYLKCGITEIDDQAAGVKFLRQRPYVDGAHVGVEGTSYGGYASIMCLLRYPDVFQAASASSSVTDWRNYDTIYTERYMWTPEGNKTGYDAGSAMTYAKDLRGRLLLYYGTADNNVHPANTFQLIVALQQAGKSFEVQVGPDQEHSAVNQERMIEFFLENLMPETFHPVAVAETH